jgi:hypothetical protein
MRLEEITLDMLRRSLDAYVAVAYQSAPLPLTVKSRIAFIREFPGDDLAQLLSRDIIERTPADAETSAVTAYGVRLGNEKYPHMKLIIRRAADDDWRFAVDCHDGAFEVVGTPDGLRAQELKDYNMALREKIEALWREEDLPAVEEA